MLSVLRCLACGNPFPIQRHGRRKHRRRGHVKHVRCVRCRRRTRHRER